MIILINHENATNYTYAAKNPGSWGNGLKVCFIDNAADQIIGITTTDPGALGQRLDSELLQLFLIL
jgi:hypothetical protein